MKQGKQVAPVTYKNTFLNKIVVKMEKNDKLDALGTCLAIAIYVDLKLIHVSTTSIIEKDS